MSILKTFHLRLKSSDFKNATLAILPGDPGRVKKIALLMDNAQYLYSNREFVVWSAELKGKTIIVCSTGIGGSSTSIAVEELAQLGIRTFLRVGTAGAIQSQIRVGDMLVITAAVRCDGASQHYAPLEFPAVADLSCSMALIQASKSMGLKTHFGISVSSDTFYPGQERWDTYSGRVIKRFQGSMSSWKEMGVMSYEMESSTLFTMCASQGLKAGVIVGIVVNRVLKEMPEESAVFDAENASIKSVIKGACIILDTNYSL